MKELTVFLLTIVGINNLFSQTVAVSAKNANMFYQWIDNSVTVVVENQPCKNIIVKADTGKLEGKGCEYTFTVENGVNTATLTIGIKTHQKPKWLYSTTIRIKPLPVPWAKLATEANGGLIRKRELLAFPEVTIPLRNSFELFADTDKLQIIEFSVKIIRGDSIFFTKNNIKGDQIPKETLDFVNSNCKHGDKINIENITALIYKKEQRRISDIQLTIAEYD